MSANITTILIDQNSQSLTELKNLGCSDIKHIKKINNALQEIQSIKFEEVRVIINEKLYPKFFQEFTKNINNFFVIPKIVIYTENEESFREQNNDIIDDQFFNFCEIMTSYDDIKNFINNGLSINNNANDIEPEFIFEYVGKHSELALHLFYKVLIHFADIDEINKYTNELYKNYKDNADISNLFEPIIELKNIPVELLSKYYAKALTSDSDIYKDINKDLINNNFSNYLTYIKLLYEGISLKSFPLNREEKLYLGYTISNDELKKIQDNDELKKIKDNNDSDKDKDGIQKNIVFSKEFLFFRKNEEKAKEYLINNKNNNTDTKSLVLFILEKEDDNNIDYKLATHANVENISFVPLKGEVLFFPFSSFEIKNIAQKNINDVKYTEINLTYLGKKDVELIDEYIQKKDKERKKLEKEKNKIKEEIKEKEKEKKEKEQKEKEEKEEKETEKKESDLEDKKIEDEIENLEQKITEIKQQQDNLKEEKIEDFEFKTKIVEAQIINLADITTLEDLYRKFKNFMAEKSSKNSISIINIITGTLSISDYYINKDVRIISSFENNGSKFYSIKDEELFKYKNEEEIRNNISIKISYKGKEGNDNIKNIYIGKNNFSYFYKFKKTGYYDIEYKFSNSLDKIDYLFSGCKCLKSIDLSRIDTSEIINMSGLFNDCPILQKIDLANICTGNVFDMRRMFYNCNSLTSLNLSNFDTYNVINMEDMFRNCSSLTHLDLSNFDTKNVLSMSNMFNGCKRLAVLDLKNFKFNKIESMWKMFHGCINLQLKTINNKNPKLLNEVKNFVFCC